MRKQLIYIYTIIASGLALSSFKMNDKLVEKVCDEYIGYADEGRDGLESNSLEVNSQMTTNETDGNGFEEPITDVEITALETSGYSNFSSKMSHSFPLTYVTAKYTTIYLVHFLTVFGIDFGFNSCNELELVQKRSKTNCMSNYILIYY